MSPRRPLVETVQLTMGIETQVAVVGNAVRATLHPGGRCVVHFYLFSNLNLIPQAEVRIDGKNYAITNYLQELLVVDQREAIEIQIATNAKRIKFTVEPDGSTDSPQPGFYLRQKAPAFDCNLDWHLTTRCNLRCEYCFLSLESRVDGALAPIDIPSLERVLDQSGMTFDINFTGGEPFMVENFIEASAAVARKHYLSVVSNLVTGRVKRFLDEVDRSRIDYFLASFHYRELVERRAVGTFLDNYNLLREAAVPNGFTMVLHPSLLARMPEIRAAIGDQTIEIIYEPFIGTFAGKTYPAAYTDAELAALDIDREDVMSAYYPNGVACNAGHNTAFITADGYIFDCFANKTCLGHIYRGFELYPRLRTCRQEGCTIPIYRFYPTLFAAAAGPVYRD